MVAAIRRQIVEHGGVYRGSFGVTLQDLTPDLARALDLPAGSQGAVVSEVKSGSAAAQAGLQAGDLIVGVNQQAVRSATDLRTQLALLRVGERLGLEIMRDGRSRRLSAQMADPFKDFVPGRSISRQLSGALFGEVIDESGLGTNPGIEVRRVGEDSDAWQAGLRDGDVLFQVNRERVKNLEQLREAASERILQIRLRRGDRLVTLVSR
jgi:S1-C subfamily serine protease